MIGLFTNIARGLSRFIPWVIIGIGVWLFFWNPVDFITQGLDHGIWDWSILTGGWLSMAVGLIVIFIGYKLFKIKVF